MRPTAPARRRAPPHEAAAHVHIQHATADSPAYPATRPAARCRHAPRLARTAPCPPRRAPHSHPARDAGNEHQDHHEAEDQRRLEECARTTARLDHTVDASTNQKRAHITKPATTEPSITSTMPEKSDRSNQPAAILRGLGPCPHAQRRLEDVARCPACSPRTRRGRPPPTVHCRSRARGDPAPARRGRAHEAEQHDQLMRASPSTTPVKTSPKSSMPAIRHTAEPQQPRPSTGSDLSTGE
jgi:hypothetical protein